MTAVELVFAARALVGEGPFWEARTGRLHWVDIERHQIHQLDPASGVDVCVTVDRAVGTALPRTDAPGWIAGLRDGVALLDEFGVVERHVAVEADLHTNRMNDAACDALGRFWTGTMDEAGAEGRAALYRVDPDLGVSRLVDGVSLSNGIGWSPDGATMYYVDTVAETLDAFAFAFDLGDGAVSARRTLADLHDQPGRPDGLAVDVDGCVWVAMWGGAAVQRVTPDGRLDRRISVPATQVASAAFGGSRLDTLFLTTACTGFDRARLEAEPLAGSVFSVDVGVAGLPMQSFTPAVP